MTPNEQAIDHASFVSTLVNDIYKMAFLHGYKHGKKK